MFLPYGRDPHGHLIHISESPPGHACGLVCPFCAGPLTAKKGRILAHHFAHQSDTCRPTIAGGDDLIPSYEGYFILGLTKAQRRTLQQIIAEHGDSVFYTDRLNVTVRRALAAKNYLRTRFELNPSGYTRQVATITAKARAFAGQLSLAGFARFIHRELLQAIAQNDDPVAQEILTREQERLRQTSLYFLEIQAVNRVFHKIGITTRPIQERIAEIDAFLRPHFDIPAIIPLFTIPQAAPVEAYFKAKFSDQKLTIGQATEYFEFGPDLATVQAELTALGQAIEQGLAPALPEQPQLTGTPPRPRFRGRFWGYGQRWNPFSQRHDDILILTEITDLTTGQPVTDHHEFTLGQTFAALGELWAGDVIEFNATPDLKRPTKVTKQ